MTSIAVVSASGRTSGIGHRRRADRIAQAATRRAGVVVVRVDLDDDPDEETLVSELAALGDDVIVVDAPPSLRSDELVRRLGDLRKQGRRIVGIDGPAKNVDLLIVPSFVIHDEVARRQAEGSLDIRWGWDHLLIDQRRVAARRLAGSPLLVMTGGSDATGLGRTLPALLDARLRAGTPVEWVVGPHASEPQLPESPRLDWRVLRDLADLRPLMERAGHALAVYGVTVLELLHHGVPTVLFSPYGDRDVVQLDVLEKEGLALSATDEARAVERLAGLLEDPEAGDGLARRSAARIPESGVERVVDAIIAVADA